MKRGKKANEVLLDRTFHHSAMKTLARSGYSIPIAKMGRPDIIHNTLLQVLETPMNWEGHLQVFVHTQDEYVISVNPAIHLPKNYIRFVGLIEQLYAERRVPLEGEALLEIQRGTLRQLIRNLKTDRIVGFSTLGKPEILRAVAEAVCKYKNPTVIIGAYPKGHFTEPTMKLMDEMFKVDKRTLDAWVVAGRFIYDCEWSIGLANNRFN